MLVAFEAETVCRRCKTSNLAVQFSRVRVNKNSLRSEGVTLGWASPRCKECKRKLQPLPRRWRLSEDDAAKVNAYRAKKGWEPL